MAKKCKHWVRHVMIQEMEKIARDLGPENLDCLEISGSDWGDFGFKSHLRLTFPDFDITTDVTEPGRADIIIADQVWEHLSNPEQAMANVFASLEPGGYFLNSTPFMIKYHECPIDVSRWTPTGMRMLMERHGFEVLLVDFWGNADAVAGNLKGWPDYNPKIHSLKNDRDFPIMVWALARKPQA